MGHDACLESKIETSQGPTPPRYLSHCRERVVEPVPAQDQRHQRTKQGRTELKPAGRGLTREKGGRASLERMDHALSGLVTPGPKRYRLGTRAQRSLSRCLFSISSIKTHSLTSSLVRLACLISQFLFPIPLPACQSRRTDNRCV